MGWGLQCLRLVGQWLQPKFEVHLVWAWKNYGEDPSWYSPVPVDAVKKTEHAHPKPDEQHLHFQRYIRRMTNPSTANYCIGTSLQSSQNMLWKIHFMVTFTTVLRACICHGMPGWLSPATASPVCLFEMSWKTLKREEKWLSKGRSHERRCISRCRLLWETLNARNSYRRFLWEETPLVGNSNCGRDSCEMLLEDMDVLLWRLENTLVRYACRTLLKLW